MDWENIASLIPGHGVFDCTIIWNNLQATDEDSPQSSKEKAGLDLNHISLKSKIKPEEHSKDALSHPNSLSIHKLLNLCLVWLELGNSWDEIGKLLGLEKEWVKCYWLNMLRERGIEHTSNSDDLTKNKIRKLVAELKFAILKKNEAEKEILKRRKKRFHNKRSITTDLETIKEQSSQSKNEININSGVCNKNSVPSISEDHYHSQVYNSDTDIIKVKSSSHPASANETKITSIKLSSPLILNKKQETRNKSITKFLSKDIAEPSATESSEFDFSEGTEENVNCDQLRKITKRNFYEIFTPKIKMDNPM